MGFIKIAIMGAGLSGLSCAITLEKNGISPTIFEKRSQVGDRFINGEVLLSIFNKPVNDCLAYLSEKYGIYLQPVGNVNKAVIHSKNKKAEVTGHLGFSNIRGRHRHSFESQLARQVESNIIYNSDYTYEQLLEEYTHIVMAVGDGAYTARLQNYQEDLTATLRGAVVTGEFDLNTVSTWLDNDLAPHGYGWLIPISQNEANIVIGFPDYPENKKIDSDIYWERFYERACKDTGQDLNIVDRFDITRYIFGICRYPRIGNTFFIGNCFGVMMPLFGFGQFPSILTGIYAAHDLCGKGNYEDLTGKIRRSYFNSLTLRRVLERMDNKKLDIAVSSLNSRLANNIINTRTFDPLKLLSYVMRPLAIRTRRTV